MQCRYSEACPRGSKWNIGAFQCVKLSLVLKIFTASCLLNVFLCAHDLNIISYELNEFSCSSLRARSCRAAWPVVEAQATLYGSWLGLMLSCFFIWRFNFTFVAYCLFLYPHLSNSILSVDSFFITGRVRCCNRRVLFEV